MAELFTINDKLRRIDCQSGWVKGLSVSTKKYTFINKNLNLVRIHNKRKNV